MAGNRGIGEYRVDEFDMPDPDQKINDSLDALSRLFDAIRGDDAAGGAGRDDGIGVADVAEAAAESKEVGHMLASTGVARMANFGDVNGAVKLVDELSASGVLTAQHILDLRGMICNSIDDHEGELEAVVRRDEMDGKISHAHRADVLYRLGRIGEMEELCKTWEGSRQGRGRFYLCRARILRARGKLGQARRHAVAMLTLEKYSTHAVELLGDILADSGDLRGAVLQYNKALKADYKDVQFHVKKAETLVRMGRPDSAALACRRGLAVRPDSRQLRDVLEMAGGDAERSGGCI